MDEPAIWILIVSSLLGCYFGACNLAIKTYSRARLSEMLEQVGREGRYRWFIEHADPLMLLTGFMRILMTLGVLLAVLSFIQSRYGWSPWAEYGIAFAVAAVIVGIFTVAIPISWAAYFPERLIAFSIPLLRVGLFVFAPVVWMLHFTDPIVRRISGADIPRDEASDVSDEVLTVMEEHRGNGEVDEDQRDMIEAVFEFPSTTAEEIMTPRTDVKGISVDATLPEVKTQILESGHSRNPVYEGTIDNIVGVLYTKDLIRFIGAEATAPFNVRDVMREPILVPESKSVRELLAEFKASKVHIAIVLDEYGGTAGIVTIEDIVEELVGEIHDEYEEVVETPTIHRLDKDVVDVDARVYIDDLNDALNLDLPEDEDFDTVGGFVFSTLGHVPESGETFEFDNVRMRVLEAERNRVIRVRVERLETVAAENGKANGHGR